MTKDGDVIIKPADKSGATVIMDRFHYETEINKLLSNEEFYKVLNKDPSKKVKKEYNKLVIKEEYGLKEDEIYYLINLERKESNFYGLPKIHKSKEISERCKNSEQLI